MSRSLLRDFVLVLSLIFNEVIFFGREKNYSIIMNISSIHPIFEIHFKFFNRTYVFFNLIYIITVLFNLFIVLYWFLHLINRFWVKNFDFSLYFIIRLNIYWILHYFFYFLQNILVSCIISLKISKNYRFVQSCQLNNFNNWNMNERELNDFLLTHSYTIKAEWNIIVCRIVHTNMNLCIFLIFIRSHNTKYIHNWSWS